MHELNSLSDLLLSIFTTLFVSSIDSCIIRSIYGLVMPYWKHCFITKHFDIEITSLYKTVYLIYDYEFKNYAGNEKTKARAGFLNDVFLK